MIERSMGIARKQRHIQTFDSFYAHQSLTTLQSPGSQMSINSIRTHNSNSHRRRESKDPDDRCSSSSNHTIHPSEPQTCGASATPSIISCCFSASPRVSASARLSTAMARKTFSKMSLVEDCLGSRKQD